MVYSIFSCFKNIYYLHKYVAFFSAIYGFLALKCILNEGLPLAKLQICKSCSSLTSFKDSIYYSNSSTSIFLGVPNIIFNAYLPLGLESNLAL